jgi:hypothetical protein
MDVRPHRRFTIKDAIVLVAATGIGFAGARSQQADAVRQGYVLLGTSHFYGFFIFALPVSLFLAWTLALLVLRLLRPRPRYRRLIGSPGFTVYYAIGLGATFTVYSFALERLIQVHNGANRMTWIYELFRFNNYSISTYVAPGVASGWFLLYLFGRWRRRSDRDWIEVCGIALGFGWIVLMAGSQINF